MKKFFTLLVLSVMTFTTTVGAQDPPKHNDLQKQICEQTQPSASFNFEVVQAYEITAPVFVVSAFVPSAVYCQAATSNVEFCSPTVTGKTTEATKYVQPIRSTIRMLQS